MCLQTPGKTLPCHLHAFIRWLVGSPVYDRLYNEIKSVEAEIEHDIKEGGAEHEQATWVTSAKNELKRAEEHLSRWEVESAWDAVHASKRFQLSNPLQPDRLQNEVVGLRLEAEKIEGWRGTAILKLLEEPADTAARRTPDRIIVALCHRDQASQNLWFKIMLRRRHLFSLFLLAWLTVCVCLLLSWTKHLEGFLGNFNQVLMAVLFGTMGGVVGVASSLVVDKVSARIPAQQIGAFLVWMRPGIGAVAALVVLAGWKASVDTRVLNFVAAQPATAVGLSFLAGFSERFLVGALSKLSRETDRHVPV